MLPPLKYDQVSNYHISILQQQHNAPTDTIHTGNSRSTIISYTDQAPFNHVDHLLTYILHFHVKPQT